MPKSLRSGLWDIMRHYYLCEVAERDIIGQVTGYGRSFDAVTYKVWFHFFKESVDERPRSPLVALDTLRDFFFRRPFFEAYGLLEFLAKSGPSEDYVRDDFPSQCNEIFERERAQFRFAGRILVKVTDDAELSEVAQAMSDNPSTSVKVHIQRAAELYSDATSPDFRNSIKESISAVEAAVSYVTGERPGGVSKPLKRIMESYSLHPALRDGFEKLYAYSSDANGIRHALMEEENLKLEDAKYMLVACSAFSNYLVSIKAREG
ncbi:hypothetical protein SAMN05421665_1385 [Yoonia rosea]|uniref:HEPN AbiJ-N-terminal domain-containing protein n=2 Tax=Yoonia rosea TaxID=287098 RepID=A0A1R3WVL7_9RHOB|nr:hypothetical protein SAMN05421665_1385 [Yoonia rosea]